MSDDDDEIAPEAQDLDYQYKLDMENLDKRLIQLENEVNKIKKIENKQIENKHDDEVSTSVLGKNKREDNEQFSEINLPIIKSKKYSDDTPFSKRYAQEDEDYQETALGGRTRKYKKSRKSKKSNKSKKSKKSRKTRKHHRK